MKAKRTILSGIGIVFVIALIVAVALPILTAKTNCGGNSWALTACKTYATVADITAQDNHSQFEVGKIGKDERQNFFELAGNHWGMNGADFLIKTNFALGSSSSREVIIVSKRKFGNVPQPTIWNFLHKNPAYAVGYSDGKTGLISPAEFTNLNLSGFVPVASLATNSEFNFLKK
jgi:hypothetical protein